MNILLSNNIVISVTQFPTDPLPGDTVVFQATQSVENSVEYSDNNNNYFYSYNWLVSRDGGSTYTTAGPDLETLTLENISSSFFNEIYKLEVTLIDLDNMLLTEDGDVLTGEVGSVLLIDNNGLLSIQNTVNNNASSVSITNTNTTETAVDLIDSMAVTEELAAFDPLIDAEIADTINSGQGISIRNNVAQNISNDPIDIFLEDDPLPSVVLPTQTQSINIQSGGYARITNESYVGCNTALKYRECVPYDDFFHAGMANYSSLNECVSAGSCNLNSTDTDVTISTSDIIGTLPKWKSIRADTNSFHCCSEPEELCKGGIPTCNRGKYEPDEGCTTYDAIEQQQPIAGIEEDPEIEQNCACNPANNSDVKLGELSFDTVQDSSGTAVLASSPFVIVPDPLGVRKTGLYRVTGTAARVTGQAAGTVAKSGIWRIPGWGIILTLVATVVIIAVIIYINNQPVEKQLKAFVCFDRYYKRRYKCGDDIIELDSKDKPGGTTDDIVPANKYYTPNYNCVCKKGSQTYGGSINLKKDEDLNSCRWVVTSYTGKAGSSCECSLTNGASSEGGQLNPTYSYSIPAVPTTCDLPAYVDSGCLFGVSAAEYADCYFKSDKCSAECDGPLCCNSPKSTIFVLSNGGSSNKACNQSIPIQLSEDVHMRLAACPTPTATNTVTIQQVSITERPRKCGEIADPSKNLFASYNDAKTAAQKQIQPGDVLIISKFKPIQDMSKKTELSPEIKRNGIVIAPALNSYYDTVYDTYEKIGDECDMCKVWYSVAVTGSSYACDSGPISCGAHTIPKQCNNPSSPDSTAIKIATIDKITSYNFTKLKDMKDNPNEFFPDCGAATSKAESLVSKGFICTTW